MGRPKEHDESTRAALLDAAERILARDGADAISVRAVADDADTTTRAVYSLFGSKDGLLVALAVRAWERLAHLIDALPTMQDPIADIAEITVKGYRRWALENTNRYLLAFALNGPDPDPEVHRASRYALRRLQDRIGRAHDAGLFGRTHPDVVTAMVQSVCEGIVTVGLRGRLLRGRDGARVQRQAIKALLRGLAP